MAMKKKLLQLTDELWATIDAARGDTPRSPWIESQLWKLGTVRKAAKAEGIKKPTRAADGRGRWERKK